MTSSPTPQPENTSRRPSTAFLIVAVVLFGIGMALLGYFAGQTKDATQTALPTSAAVADIAATEPAADPTATPQPATESPSDATASDAVAGDAGSAQEQTAPTAEPASPTPVPTEEAQADSPTAEAAPTTEPGVSPLEDADFAILKEAWEVVAEQFDGDLPSTDDVLHAAIIGSLETLDDDYTRYAPPNIAERMREDMEGSVEGIGAYVQENDEGAIEIVRPIDGQPADIAGLKGGDIILAVNGESTDGQTLDEVVLKVRGPAGTTVDLTVGREGVDEPLEFTITRARYEVPVVESELLPAELTGDKKIGRIWLTEFNRNAEDHVREALQALLDQGAEAIIFDLRDNPGGFLDQAVGVGDVFLPEGVLLYERNRSGLDETFSTDDGDFGEEIPMVVLVNEGSASASEIVAGAIQDRDRATLIGMTTFGKGSVQLINQLSDGSELRVTTARWYTPNNKSISKEGITPDIEVETPDDLGGADDAQLIRAIEFLNTGQ